MNKNNGNNEQAKKDALIKIASINMVEGFEPMSMALEFGNMNDGSKRYHLPVKVQIAWFRLKYPEGRIAVKVKMERDFFIAEAKVYVNYLDPAESYLGEGSASRGYTKENPTVSPREWAQTAAIGIALRNAGFGLQADVAGESFEDNTLNEFPFTNIQETPNNDNNPTNTGVSKNNTPAETNEQNFSPTENQPEIQSDETIQLQIEPEISPLEKAMAAICPISKYKGKTLEEMIRIDTNTLPYIAKNGGKYGQEIADFAKIICEHALEQAAG